MKARNDENLEGIQSLARELGRLLPGGGARGEAIAELQARAEAAERDRDEAIKARDEWESPLEATLAAVREFNKRCGPWAELTGILDGEGEKCPTCGGTDRDGGTVATSGPDEFGNYETDDCPDGWHT